MICQALCCEHNDSMGHCMALDYITIEQTGLYANYNKRLA